MSLPREPAQGALLFAFLFAPSVDQKEVIDRLSDRFGAVALASEPFDFDFTRYYDSEMGQGILRMFCLFRELTPQGRLAEIKVETNRMEADYAERGKRRVNLDPGILTPNRLVLATGKDAPHRIYLKDGIFADLTLIFESGRFVPQAWTYPDYRDPRTLDFLYQARKYYLERLQGESEGKE